MAAIGRVRTGLESHGYINPIMCMLSIFLDPILNFVNNRMKRGDRENSAKELNIFLAVGSIREDPLASPSAGK